MTTGVRGVVFPEPGRVELSEVESGPVGAGEVAVRTLYSLLSAGTELRVLNRQWEAGSHWDQWVTYPAHPGYAAVGEVVERGQGVDELAAGDLVVLRKPHASRHVVPTIQCTRVPANVDVSLAPWFALGKIALMGARAARHGLGHSVVVIGAGPIGQMSTRWATAAGARAVVAIDPVPARLELARRGGATAIIAKPVAETADDVRAAVGTDGADVVIDATGNAEVLASALGLVRARGRLVVLGDTGTPSGQHLTSDVIVRGVTIVGAHDSHSMPDRVRDLLMRAHAGEQIADLWATLGALGWDADRSIHTLFFHLVGTGRFSLDGLNTHTFDPRDCAEAYRLAGDNHQATMGVLFDWTTL